MSSSRCRADHVACWRDGKTLAGSCGDNAVRLWAWRRWARHSRRRSRFGGHRRILAVAVSPDGRTVASGGKDRTVRLWEAETGGERKVLRGPAGWTEALAFTPAGDVLVSGAQDGTVWVWEPSSGKELGRLAGHSGPVRAVAFSERGSLLATAAADGTALVWSLPDLLRAAKPQPVTLTAAELRHAGHDWPATMRTRRSRRFAR
jgi:WD40 repeat protein